MAHILWYIFIHATGIDSQQSRFYDFWSGVATQLSVVGALVVGLRHKNCHVKGCWRIGHLDPLVGWVACKRHHTSFTLPMEGNNKDGKTH